MVFSDANQPLIKGVSFIYVPHHPTNTHTDSLNTIFPLDFLLYLLPSPFLPPKPGSGWSGLLILGSEVLGVVTGLPPLPLSFLWHYASKDLTTPTHEIHTRDVSSVNVWG